MHKKEAGIERMMQKSVRKVSVSWGSSRSLKTSVLGEQSTVKLLNRVGEWWRS